MQNKVLAVNIEINSEDYKLISVVHSIDEHGDNFYVFYSNQEYIKQHAGKQILPIKYSRHASGKSNRFTFGSTQSRFGQFKPKDKIPINQLNGAEGLIYMSLQKLDSSLIKMLDKVDKKRGYLYTEVIDAKDYTNLTLQFFVANADYPLSNARFNYKTIKEFPFGNFKIVLATRDLWIDPNKYKRKQVAKLLQS